MSKKLPKDNLKKVSGAKGAPGPVHNIGLQGKKVAGEKQFALEGKIGGGRNLDKGISSKNVVENE